MGVKVRIFLSIEMLVYETPDAKNFEQKEKLFQLL